LFCGLSVPAPGERWSEQLRTQDRGQGPEERRQTAGNGRGWRQVLLDVLAKRPCILDAGLEGSLNRPPAGIQEVIGNEFDIWVPRRPRTKQGRRPRRPLRGSERKKRRARFARIQSEWKRNKGRGLLWRLVLLRPVAQLYGQVRTDWNQCFVIDCS